MTFGGILATLGDVAAVFGAHWWTEMKRHRTEQTARREMPSLRKNFADEVFWNLMLNKLDPGNRKDIMKRRAKKLRKEQKADLIISLYEIYREDPQAAIDILNELARADDKDWKDFGVERELFKSKERLYRWHEMRVRMKATDRSISRGIGRVTSSLRAVTARHRTDGYEGIPDSAATPEYPPYVPTFNRR